MCIEIVDNIKGVAAGNDKTQTSTNSLMYTKIMDIKASFIK